MTPTSIINAWPQWKRGVAARALVLIEAADEIGRNDPSLALTPDGLREFVTTMLAESSGRRQTRGKPNADGTVDEGPYQLNPVHKLPASVTFSYFMGAHEALRLWKQSGHAPWHAWGKRHDFDVYFDEALTYR